MFYGLIAIAAILTFLALKINLLLFRMAASCSWLALGIWLLVGGVLDLGDPWTQILGFVFIMMTIAPLTLQMVTEVKREKGGFTWSTWGKPPKEERMDRASEVKAKHRERLKAAREHRRFR